MYASQYVIQCNVPHEEYLNERATRFESTWAPVCPGATTANVRRIPATAPSGSCAGDGVQLSQRNGISHRRPWENDSSSGADRLVSFLRYNISVPSSISDCSTTESVHLVMRIGQWLGLNYVAATVVETPVSLWHD